MKHRALRNHEISLEIIESRSLTFHETIKMNTFERVTVLVGETKSTDSNIDEIPLFRSWPCFNYALARCFSFFFFFIFLLSFALYTPLVLRESVCQVRQFIIDATTTWQGWISFLELNFMIERFHYLFFSFFLSFFFFFLWKFDFARFEDKLKRK